MRSQWLVYGGFKQFPHKKKHWIEVSVLFTAGFGRVPRRAYVSGNIDTVC